MEKIEIEDLKKLNGFTYNLLVAQIETEILMSEFNLEPEKKVNASKEVFDFIKQKIEIEKKLREERKKIDWEAVKIKKEKELEEIVFGSDLQLIRNNARKVEKEEQLIFLANHEDTIIRQQLLMGSGSFYSEILKVLCIKAIESNDLWSLNKISKNTRADIETIQMILDSKIEHERIIDQAKNRLRILRKRQNSKNSKKKDTKK